MFSHQSAAISAASIAQLLDQLGLLLVEGGELAIDSRKLKPGGIFCAYPGISVDGRNFIADALARGAKVVLWEPGIKFNYPLTNYPVSGLIQQVGILAAAQFNYPSQDIYNIAVTGTNGKTSISHWLNQAFSFLGHKTAIIGTTGAGVYPKVADYASTTPDPLTLQALLAKFKQQAVEVLAMEVSSHALEQGRVNGVAFKSAIFTNLSLDHLDYHKTMENYFQAKKKLFYWDGLQHAIINSDDEYGRRLMQSLANDNPGLKILSYGIESGILRADQIRLTKAGISFSLNYRNSRQTITAGIVGRFNVYNLLALFGLLLLNGVEWEQLAAIAAILKPVSGRMDAVMRADKPLVVVDFAHTPDALEKALLTLSEIKKSGRLICVFGCGGNRDKTKRPLMGAIASRLADQAIVTTDNPREEDPLTIIAQITAGLDPSGYQQICDRKVAIQTALQQALPGDIVLIAGKGHEEYQEINGVKHYFSDLKLVRELLSET